jgi:tetratricopeptide (TPR) repeat protein
MYKVLLALLLLLVTPLLAGPLEDAEQLMDEGKPREAADLLIAALESKTVGPEGTVLATRALNQVEDWKLGIEYGKQAIEAFPERSEARLAYAIALRTKMQQVSTMKAMFIIGSYKRELRKAIELNPKNVEAREEQIGFLTHAPGIAGGDKQKARELVEELKPLDWRAAMFSLAEIHREEKDTESAISVYEAMIERDAEDFQARLALAFALQSAGNYRESDRHFKTLLENENERMSLSARYQLARSRVLGEYEQRRAVDHLTTYIAALTESVQPGLPTKSNAYWRLGMAYEQLQELDDARRSFEKAIALDGDNKLAKDALNKLGES